MVRVILEWIDKEMEKSSEDRDNVHMAKAFSLGMLEGVIDGAVVVGLIATLAGLAKKDK